MSRKVPAAGPRLGLGRVIGYGLGDFGFNLYFTFSSLFLLYFYTDVLGLSPALGGAIIMVALVWEGLTDPAMGIIANRTRTRRGRYRPYLLLGAIPLAASFVAMFVPVALEGTALAIYALATHIVFRTLYTVVNIPYIALSAQMTSDSLERGKLAGARMILAILCGLGLAALSLPLVKALGGGREGFFGLALLYGGLSTAILFACFLSTREVVAPIGEAHPTLKGMIAAVRTNRPFLLLIGATVVGSVGYTMSGKALVYYMKYNGGSEDAVTIALTASLTSAALAMVPWMLVTKRTSKRFVWLCAIGITSAVSATIYLAAPTPGPFLYALVAVGGIGNAAFVLTFWSMVPDTVEYGEWRTGVRAEGAIFGFVVLSQKIALGIGTGLVGVLLGWIGYEPNVAQTPDTLHGIRVLLTLVPLTLGFIAGLFVWRYPLDQQTHGRLVRWLALRRSRVA